MQFFQFDKAGNMYIFAPEAGCTGPTKLVKPGDKLIFSSSYNPNDWHTDDTPGDTEMPYSCPGGISTSSHEFKVPLLDEDLVELSHKNFSDETMKQIRWVRKMYREWCSQREGLGLAAIKCNLENKAMITVESLKYALCCFITEVKKLDGTEFPGKILYHIIVCMQFHRECHGFVFKLINDGAFQELKYTLDNTMKARTAQGIGCSVKKAEILSATDEDLLWSLGFLRMSHPQQLLNTIIFCIGKGFALYAGKEHRAL